jgi:hypothetical protein
MKLTTLLYRSLISVLQCNYLYILHDRPKDGIMTTTQTKGEPLDTGILYAPSILSTGILLTSAKEQTDDTMADRYQGVGTKTNVWQAAKCIYELIRCGIEVRIPMLWRSFGRSSYSSSSSHFVFLLFPLCLSSHIHGYKQTTYQPSVQHGKNLLLQARRLKPRNPNVRQKTSYKRCI